MDTDSILLSKTVRERQMLCDFTYIWNLKKQNKWTNITKRTQRFREQTGGCRGEAGREISETGEGH